MTDTRTEHTPGPWELIHFGGPQIGHKASGDAVCTMWGDENDPADPFHANARLIAAAPDILEALEIAVTLWAFQSTDAPQREWLSIAEAAIAKARGAA